MNEVALLIVDDIENNRLALSMRLELAGYDNIASATNGREALEMMRADSYNLVLLDIMMPEMDGYQVLEEMKRDTELREIPVIMISAVDDIESVIRCVELGAVDYLTKPFNPTLLKARVDAYVERTRYRAQEAAYLEQVEVEKKRADELLATLLPRPIARALKANRKLQPIMYDDITVLFTDVVGFTAYSEQHPPEAVFAELESLIGTFEDLIDTEGMVKVKSIGDGLMATAGLLEEVDEPVLAAIRCGLAMVAAMEGRETGWQVRVGIDHGPVAAGVIGRTHFQFDVWGDTVNTAARIEEAGQAGTVNVSGRAWQHVRGRAHGRSLGMIELKGKQPIEVIECDRLR